MRDQITAAINASKMATDDYLSTRAAQMGCKPHDFEVVYPCGFAWMVIKPARGPIITTLKDMGLGFKADGGGWGIWSSHMTQSMDAKAAGIKVLAAAFKKLPGAEKYTFACHTRID